MSIDLTDYLHGSWNTDDFVDLANRLLPQVLPEEGASQKVREDVNLRLVRHYTGLGMLDEPAKEGKEARYSYRHLLQLLLVRRMQAQGYGSSAIDTFPRKHNDAQLLRLVSGQLELTVQSNPALDFLEGLRQRSSPGSPTNPPPPATSSHWSRHSLVPGLELHLSNDFKCPSGPPLEHLLETIKDVLKSARPDRRKP